MMKLSLAPLLAVLAAGCAVEPRPADQPTEPEPIVVAPVGPPEPPAAEPLAADLCAELLSRLEATTPLLTGLDQRLADQTERLDAAAARLDRPPPAPRAPECPAVADSDLAGKEVIGAIEWIYMDPPGRHYRARVDSGAETSSLSAADVLEFERDGDEWVRFTYQHDDVEKPVEIELPIERVVLIRQPGPEVTDRRVVVDMDIRLGDRLQTTEFTLTDRSRMTYPVLLGRAFLMDLYVIDVSRSYTHERSEVR